MNNRPKNRPHPTEEFRRSASFTDVFETQEWFELTRSVLKQKLSTDLMLSFREK